MATLTMQTFESKPLGVATYTVSVTNERLNARAFQGISIQSIGATGYYRNTVFVRRYGNSEHELAFIFQNTLAFDLIKQPW